ncbi:MAG: hypothetical protein ACK5OB_10485 [Pirellula sp.]
MSHPLCIPSHQGRQARTVRAVCRLAFAIGWVGLILVRGAVPGQAVSWSPAPMAPFGRVVSFEVLYDGKIVFEGHRLDEGASFDTTWNYLKSLPLKNPTESYVISDEKERERLAKFHEDFDQWVDGDTATVTGKIRIFCRYAGNIEIEELRLVRTSDKKAWRMDPEQVQELSEKRTVDKQMRTRERFDEDRQRDAESQTAPQKKP